MRDQRATVRRITDRGDVDGEVLRLLPVDDPVVHDDEVVLAADDGVLEAVLDAVHARRDTAELAGRVVGLQDVALRSDLGTDADDEVLVAAGGPHPDPEALVGLVEYLHVLGPRTHVVTPHRVRPPRGVDGRVEDVLGIGRPHRPAGGVGDHVVEELAGAKILDAQRVSLVADDVGAVGEPVAVVAHRQRPEAEEVMALRLGIAVEQDLLARELDAVVDLRRGPVVLRADRAAAGDRVLLALLGPGEIPEPAAPDGHRHVGFLGAALDLVEDLLAQVGQVRRVRLGVGVLRLEPGAHLRIVLVAQPFVVVDEGVTVVGTFGGDLLGDRRLHVLAVGGHAPTSASGHSSKDFCVIHS